MMARTRNLSPRLASLTRRTAPNRDSTGRYEARHRPAGPPHGAGETHPSAPGPQPNHSRRRASTTAGAALVTLTLIAGCGSTGTVTMTPAETMSHAAQRAGRDGLILMGDGTYPAQTVDTGTTGDCYARRDDLGTSDCRTFLVPQGSQVRIGNLRIEGAGTAIVARRGDLRIDGAYSLNGASDSTIRGATITPAPGDPGVYLDHVTRFALIDSEVTGVRDNDGVDVYGGTTGSRDVLIENNDIHGVRISPDSCQHTDGIQVAGTSGPGNTGTVIRNNRIYDIDQNADVQLDSNPPQRGTDETVEGNQLGTVNYTPTSCVPTPYPRSITLAGNRLTVRDNDAAQPFFVYPGSGTVTANRAPAPQFSGGASCSTYAFSGNVWSANPYGTSCP